MIKIPEKKIRVLVADDSAFMCKVLKEIINSDAQLEVAAPPAMVAKPWP